MKKRQQQHIHRIQHFEVINFFLFFFFVACGFHSMLGVDHTTNRQNNCVTKALHGDSQCSVFFCACHLAFGSFFPFSPLVCSMITGCNKAVSGFIFMSFFLFFFPSFSFSLRRYPIGIKYHALQLTFTENTHCNRKAD